MRAPQVVAAAGSAQLLDYGGSGRPVLFVPSLVNPPYVLDLDEDGSLLRRLAANGLHPLLVDWRAPGPPELAFSVGDYVAHRLRPLIDAIGEDVDLAGYCLGGTMALAVIDHPRVRRVVTIAAPWDFGGYSAARRQDLADYWIQSSPLAASLGSVPMDLIQPAFWSLDPAAAVRKFEKFADLDPASDAARTFIALEDWANDGPPVTLPAARECFEDFFGGNVTGRGTWCADPAASGKPILNIVSQTDRIVPAASAPGFGEQWLIAAGHVGMIVGSRAREQLWQPLAGWLRG